MEDPSPPPPPPPQSSSCLVEYTSLKDIMPWQTSSYPYDPRSVDSWRQIPIKHPLLQHAAWAYLLPTSTSSQLDDHRRKGSGSFILLSKMMEKCGICFSSGCLGEFLEEACWSKVRKLFVKNAATDDDGENDYDNGDHEIIQENYHVICR